jgi:hypothetical protein
MRMRIAHQFLMRTQQFLADMFSARISSLHICLACLEGTFQILNFYAYVEHTRKIFFQISYVRSVHTLVPGTYAQCTHQFLTCMLSARISSLRSCCGYTKWTFKNAKMGMLMRMLSMHVRYWCVWSGCASVPNTHTHQFLTLMLSVRIMPDYTCT